MEGETGKYKREEEEEERKRGTGVSVAEAEAGLASSPCSSHLLELWRAQGVVDFLAARREALPARQEGQQPLLHLSIAQDGSHHLRGAHAGQVHCSVWRKGKGEGKGSVALSSSSSSPT